MKRTLSAVAASLAVFTLAPAAFAQAAAKGDFGEQGQFIIGADRLLPLFGYNHWSYDLPTAGAVTKNNASGSSWNLSFLYGGTPWSSSLAGLGGNGGALGGVFGNTNLPFTVPRIGLDYVIVPNVTIGGDLVVYFTVGGNSSTEVDLQGGQTMTTSNDNPGVTLFGIAPRGGYILGLNDMFSLWLRGGFSYYTWTAKQTVTNNGNSTTYTASQNQPAIDLEPQVVFHIIPHVGFTAGLTLDIPFAGGYSDSTASNGQTNTTSNSASLLYFGVNLGMLAYF
jgi:hypothetical protein